MADQYRAHVSAWENWKQSKHHTWAHKMARDHADKYSDPIIDPRRYAYFYWQVMWNNGYRPYIPGMTGQW